MTIRGQNLDTNTFSRLARGIFDQKTVDKNPAYFYGAGQIYRNIWDKSCLIFCIKKTQFLAICVAMSFTNSLVRVFNSYIGKTERNLVTQLSEHWIHKRVRFPSICRNVSTLIICFIWTTFLTIYKWQKRQWHRQTGYTTFFPTYHQRQRSNSSQS